MFLHNFKYELITTLKNKDFLIWLVIFPIILGTLFKIAFSNIYENEIMFNTIPVAVVQKETDEIFNQVMTEVSEGEESLFKATYCNEEEALAMLKNSDVAGIIYSDSMTLTVHQDNIEQSIIKSFMEQYQTQKKVITEIAITNPEKLEHAIEQMNFTGECNKNIPLTDGNMDDTIQYFYNLIAMVALYGSITGLHIAITNQGNLSQIGARKCCSPTNKLISMISALSANFIAQILCTFLAITYIIFVLKVDMGDNIPLVYLAGAIGGILGISFGFMIGSFGNMKENAKSSLATSITMTSCFFSGLMVSGMKAVVEMKAPWFNRINPASVISDTFYCLNVYNDYKVYTEKIITMIIMTVIFTTIGFLLTRRKKYASL